MLQIFNESCKWHLRKRLIYQFRQNKMLFPILIFSMTDVDTLCLSNVWINDGNALA